MRPQNNFGQDITNTSRGNDENGSNDNNRTQIISRLAENGAVAVAPRAGKDIIRVVRRCDSAKENKSLGK